MLRKRVITAVVLIGIVLAVMYALPLWGMQGLMGIILLAATWEWTWFTWPKSTGSNLVKRCAYLLLLFGLGLGSLYYCPTLWVLVLGGLWWIAAFILLLYFAKHPQQRYHCFWYAILGGLLVLPCWVGGNQLMQYGKWQLLLILAFVAIVDSSAYLLGRCWGQRKLCPMISPGKTIVGFWGGVVPAGIFMVLMRHYQPQLFFNRYWTMWAIAVLGGAGAVIGDLWISMVKRQCGVKDSGTFLPGHGGVLDRIDGLMAAVPWSALILLIAKQKMLFFR